MAGGEGQGRSGIGREKERHCRHGKEREWQRRAASVSLLHGLQHRAGLGTLFSGSVCLTLCDCMAAACQASLSFTISQSLLKLMSIDTVMPSNRPILYHLLLLLPSNFPSIMVEMVDMVDTQQIFLKFWVGVCVDEDVMARENSYKICQSYSPFSKHLPYARSWAGAIDSAG